MLKPSLLRACVFFDIFCEEQCEPCSYSFLRVLLAGFVLKQAFEKADVLGGRWLGNGRDASRACGLRGARAALAA